MMISILLAVGGFACMGLLYLSYALHNARCRSSALEETEHDLHRRVDQLEQELRALCTASVGAGDHVVRLEQQVQRIMERQNQLELRTSGERPYTQASQLVDRGADIDELMESCGLTRGEAELLVMMQRGAA